MNVKKLGYLVILLIILALAFYLLNTGEVKRIKDEQLTAFPEIADRIARLTIEQGPQQIELKVVNNQWVIPSRDGYAADSGKVNSFILRLAEMRLSQVATQDESTYADLGVSEQAVKSGRTKVTFYAQDDTKLGAIYLGRDKTATTGKTTTNSFRYEVGTYVRRDGDKVVYVSGEPIPVSMAMQHWLSIGLVNEINKNIETITQYNQTPDSNALSYTLQSAGEIDGQKQFKLAGEEIPLNAMATPLVTSGLENLRLDDVFKEGRSELQGINFDKLTVYKLNNGVTYKIRSAAKDKIVFAKIEKSCEEVAGKDTICAKLGADINVQYKDWVFMLPEYLGKKFRQELADIVDNKKLSEQEQAAQEAAADEEAPEDLAPELSDQTEGLDDSGQVTEEESAETEPIETPAQE
ncbi:MAG: DUF4340 domain-containing protein [Deltaproteobacteria bacterium]|nr:DUF4340 domain-containing protein [Deltaproteobacteria bacterium]